MHLGGAGIPKDAHDLARRRSADDRVVDHRQPLPPDGVGERVQLELDAALAKGGCRLDERPPDVPVLHQPVAVRDPARLREALRRRGGRLGNGNDHVAIDGSLLCQQPSHLTARLVEAPTVEAGVGPGKIGELEQAECGPRRLGEAHRAQAPVIEAHELTGLDLADVLRPHHVQGARLGGDAPATGEAADGEGTQPVRIARGEHAALVHHHEAEATLEHRQDLERRPFEAVIEAIGQQRRDEIGVGGGPPPPPDERRQLGGVHQVPVVADGQAAAAPVLERGLGVLPRRRSGRRVPSVPDAEVALQRRQRPLVEDLGDQAELAIDDDPVALGDGHPGRLLTTMLKREEAEEGEPSDVLPGRPDAEEAARFPRALASHD